MTEEQVKNYIAACKPFEVCPYCGYNSRHTRECLSHFKIEIFKFVPDADVYPYCDDSYRTAEGVSCFPFFTDDFGRKVIYHFFLPYRPGIKAEKWQTLVTEEEKSLIRSLAVIAFREELLKRGPSEGRKADGHSPLRGEIIAYEPLEAVA